MLYIFYPNKNIHINKELATKDNPYIEYKDGEPKKIETGRARRREYLEEIKKERKNGKN